MFETNKSKEFDTVNPRLKEMDRLENPGVSFVY